MDNQEIISLILNLLSIVGGSSIAAALIPLKYRKYLPILVKALDFIGANFGSAKNATPEQIEEQKTNNNFRKHHKKR
jgi:hypothetical protein